MSDKKVQDHQILSAIAELTGLHGYPPTYREVAAQVGLSSSSTVFARVKGLRERKLIEPATQTEDKVHTRGLILTEAGWEQIGQVPLLLSRMPRVRHLPVFRSTNALQRYLRMPSHREMVPPARRLADQDVQLIPLAELRITPMQSRGGRL